MYKFSHFTKVIRNTNIFLISVWSGKVFAFYDSKVLDRIMNMDASKLNQEEQKIQNKLVEENVIIEKNKSEDYIAELKYYDLLYDNTCNLTILPTEQCNFRCAYCYEKFKSGKMSKETVDSIIKFLTKNARRFSVFNISWFGGEPLLALDIIEYFTNRILDISRFYHIPYISSMTTNGFLLDFKTFERLLKWRVNSFQITIDGTENSHNKSRYTKDHADTYRQIINNLIEIKNNAKNKHFTISIRCNLSKESYDNLDDFIEEMNYFFGSDKRFEFYFRPIGNWNGKNYNEENILKSDQSIIQKLLSNPVKLNYSSYLSLLFAQQCITTNRNRFVIRSNGSVSKCTVYLDESIIGNIDKNGNMQIDLQKLGKWILPVEIDNCKECSFNSRCHGYSCPAKKVASKSAISDCGYELSSIEKIIDLIFQSDYYNKTSNILFLDA